MIWTHTENELKKFLEDMNSYNPALKYTHHYSTSSVDFLDLTICHLQHSRCQKPHNLYQYLHYASNHQRVVYKGIISGELIRYVRTNTSEVNYEVMKNLFVSRLLSRGYPKALVEKQLLQ